MITKFIISIPLILSNFWRLHPALLYALSMLLGFYAALEWHFILLILLFLLFFPIILFQFYDYAYKSFVYRLLFAIFLSLASFAYTKIHYQFPQLPKEGLEGIAYLDIQSVQSSKNHFSKIWLYKGDLLAFFSLREPEIPIARHIPYKLSINKDSKLQRPPAHHGYKVEGRLKEPTPGMYVFVPNKKVPWEPLRNTFSLAEWRLKLKTEVSNYIKHNITDMSSANFLAGIATGDFDDRHLMYEFSRFGVQHITAISGFHFNIIAAILSLILRFFLNRKMSALILILLMTSYFVFLGCGPSIFRAWIATVVVLIAHLFERQSSGLNTLGIALMLILIIDPLMCQNIGCQLSFISTAAILLFFSPSDLALQSIWKKRSLGQIVSMPKTTQHAYVILFYLRQAVALTLSVHILGFPFLLFLFHKFSLMGLVYNLFFPFLVSISMLFLILAMGFSCILTPLADLMNYINDVYTRFMLDFIFNMPTAFDYYYRVRSISSEFVLIYISFMLLIGIILHHYLNEKKQVHHDFSFL